MTMFGMGVMEFILIAVIFLLIFGGNRIPAIGKGLGGAVREFRKIRHNITGTKPKAKKHKTVEQDESSSIESEISRKLLENVPGVKKVMDIKDKVKKVEDVINKV
jgi:sec-independent protein translocase protein TatA